MMPLAICAIFRNEACYLREWIEFHRMMGVEKFFLYQHYSDDNWIEVLQPYTASGLVEVMQWRMESPCQLAAYDDFLRKHAGEKLQVAFIDCDEFLFSPEYPSVPEALATLPAEWGAVGVNWVCFGAGEQKHYEDGFVIERFPWRLHLDNPINLHIKTIVRLDQKVNVGGTAHFFDAEFGTFSEASELLRGPFTYRHSSQLLRINHYSSKSWDEWMERKKYGRVDLAGPNVSRTFYDDVQGMDVRDLDIQRFLPELRERLAYAEVH